MTLCRRDVGLLLLGAGAAGLLPGGARAAAGNRVVCVSKQINEFIFDIGAQSHLVARDLTSIQPPQIRRLPSVGYHRALSAEGIISMRPSVLLTDGNVGPEPVLAQVRSVGVPIETMEPGTTPESAQALMLRLGRYFGRDAAARTVVTRWRGEMARALADMRRFAGKPRPRVLVIHFGQLNNSYLGLSRGGPADAIVAWAGGVNAVGQVGGMARLTPEIIAAAAPDIIIATDVGYDRYGSAERFRSLPGIALTPAGKSLAIHRIFESEIMYFTPRTPAALRKVAGWLHPAR
ncbi:heme/hemin ABC transporter substrate-binding protein [Sphingomonas jatrophae]|uniref:Iron complex transport system substrate-binding protein n=1 Tax=Sphingomonas jatrophae TaxID=1166337 RepID=A0A1I6K8H3_9SPHN|nr:ABC transporter substrate-binding protein [Sphingomonas jatrophae]SFR87497.1 iron complex transport system substrate-binding protein [Sphingomonas jatrophae]